MLVRSVSSPEPEQNQSRMVGVGKPATRAFGHVIFLCVHVKVNLSSATVLFVAIHRHSIDRFLSMYIYIYILLSGYVDGCIKLLK